MEVSINKEQKLFVFNHGTHVTCLGFYVAQKRLIALSKELGIEVKAKRVGTLKMYNEYQQAIKLASLKSKTGWRSQSELIPEFIGNEGKRVEVIDCYGDKRRFKIGKSTGFIPCHIELANVRSHGGISVYGYPFKSIRFV